MMIDVVELDLMATYPLRRSVLRDGTKSDEVVFDGDELLGTFHIGVANDGAIVAVSTWMPRRYPDLPEHEGYQLRGMATDPKFRGLGYGAAMLADGSARCARLGGTALWARARERAVSFYMRHGFELRGLPYTDLTTGLPHRDIVKFLR